MFETVRDERGFTVVELLVVLGILAILIAIVVPNLAGFLGKGKQASFEADRDIIQAAVDAFYTSSATKNLWPTVYDEITIGFPFPPIPIYYITMDDLVTHNFLQDVPDSAGSWNASGGTGSYIWYVDTNGIVQALSIDDFSLGFNGNYP